MKTCIETIKNWVNQIGSRVADVDIVYGINHDLDYHIVVIKPSSVYNSEEYIKLESSFNDEFYSLFPNENIIITDDNSIIDITEFVIIRNACSMERKSVRLEYEFNDFNRYDRMYKEDTYALAA